MGGKSAEWKLLGVEPGQVIRVYGMRRSGNHAVINWLQRNAPSGAVFFNHCKTGAHPVESCSFIEVDGQRGVREVKDGVTVLFSYEDKVPDMSQADPFDAGVMQVDREVLIYRGFLNWSASLLKKIQPNPAFDRDKRLRIMKRSMRKYVQLLEIVQGHARGVAPVCFDAWLTSEDYRLGRLAALGWEVRDNGIGAQQSVGGGSSFGNKAPDAEALETRWELMLEDEEYQACLQHFANDPRARVALRAVFRADSDRLMEVAR